MKKVLVLLVIVLVLLSSCKSQTGNNETLPSGVDPFSTPAQSSDPSVKGKPIPEGGNRESGTNIPETEYDIYNDEPVEISYELLTPDTEVYEMGFVIFIEGVPTPFKISIEEEMLTAGLRSEGRVPFFKNYRDEDSEQIAEDITSDSSLSPEQEFFRMQTRIAVLSSFEELSPRQRYILAHYLGIIMQGRYQHVMRVMQSKGWRKLEPLDNIILRLKNLLCYLMLLLFSLSINCLPQKSLLMN